MDIYFEKLVEDSKIPNKTLITLSELRRKDFSVIDNVLSYYNHFLPVHQDILYKRISMITHPKFVWNETTSTNWNFEKVHLEHLLSELYFENAKEEKDEKQTFKLCKQSTDFRNKALQTLQGLGWVSSHIRLLPILNERFHLHKLFDALALKYYTMYKYKKNGSSIRLAYQLHEISRRLWGGRILDYKYMAESLNFLANEMEDDRIGERIALLNKVIGKPGVPAEVVANHQTWMTQNDQVFFKPIKTDVQLETISLLDALHLS